MSDIFERTRDFLRRKLMGSIEAPIVNLLVFLRVSPNMVTILGFIIVLISVWFICTGHFKLGGLMIFISGFMDVFDGALARKLNKESIKGAFFDSVLDRLGESIILIGIVYYYVFVSLSSSVIILTCITLVFSLLISYLRARLEGLGKHSSGGIFTRLERGLVVCTGLIFFTPFITMVVLAIGTTIGFFYRFNLYWKLFDRP